MLLAAGANVDLANAVSIFRRVNSTYDKINYTVHFLYRLNVCTVLFVRLEVTCITRWRSYNTVVPDIS